MSAPPIAITMWMPKSNAMTVMMRSGVIPASTPGAATNEAANQITASSPMRFSQCRPGSSSGLPPILPESLPNATTEPEKVTAPMRMPR